MCIAVAAVLTPLVKLSGELLSPIFTLLLLPIMVKFIVDLFIDGFVIMLTFYFNMEAICTETFCIQSKILMCKRLIKPYYSNKVTSMKIGDYLSHKN